MREKTPTLESVDVRQILSEAVELVAGGARARGQAIHVTARDTPLRVRADPEQFAHQLVAAGCSAQIKDEGLLVELTADQTPAVFWQTAASGYQIVLAPEGVAAISVDYSAFLAPLFFWLGMGLLAEIMVRTYFESRQKSSYLIGERIGFDAPGRSVEVKVAPWVREPAIKQES